MDLRLNLGASDDRSKPGFLSVDIAPPADVICDLRERWPWDDSTVDEIYAKDVLEHIGSGYRLVKHFNVPSGTLIDVELVPFNGMVHAMNEAHRVLKPGGRMELIVPCYPGEAAFCDPTHGWPLWTQSTRFYFDERWNNQRGERGRLGPGMGITALFRTVGGRSGVNWDPIGYASDAQDRRKIMVILEAVK